MSVILYQHPESLYCVRVRLFLELAKISYQTKTVDLAQGEQRNAWFLDKSPTRRVPAIETAEGFVLSESLAIMQYLARKQGNWQLIGGGNFESEWRVVQWMNYLHLHVGEPLSDLIWFEHYMPRYFGRDADPALVKERRLSLQHSLPVLEAQLQKAFICGDEMSLADIVIAPMLLLAYKGKVDVTEYPRIVRWQGFWKEHECWRKVLPE